MRRRLRTLLLLAAVALVALVLRDYLGSRHVVDKSLPALLPALPEEVAAQAESWQWTETIGESTHIDVRAENFSQHADGRGTDLRGVVLRIFHVDTGTYDRVESAAMHLSEDGALYSGGETAITLGVTLDGGGAPVDVQASGVTYHPTANRASTDGDVRYAFEAGLGCSRGAAYDAGTGELLLHHDVYLERFGVGPAQSPTKIWAGRVRYLERAGRIELGDAARIEQGSRWLDCARGVVWLVDGQISRLEAEGAIGGESVGGRTARYAARRLEARFDANGALERLQGMGGAEFESASAARRMNVRGGTLDLRYAPAAESGGRELRGVEAADGAEASLKIGSDGGRTTLAAGRLALHLGPGSVGVELVETLERGRLEQRPVGAELPTSAMEADRIRLAFASGDRIEEVVGEGRAGFEQPSTDGSGLLRTWSHHLRAAVSADTGEILGIRQTGGFRFEEELRRGSAHQARFDVASGSVELAGDASVEGGGASVVARRILLNRSEGSLRAEGAVGGLLGGPAAAGDEGPRLGLFDAEEPVYAAADSVTSDSATGALEYRGRARLWQRMNRIDADMIVIDQEERSIVAGGGVLMAWSAVAREDGAEVAVRAAAMRYSDEERVAAFSGEVDFLRGGMRVLADQLRAVLVPSSDGDQLGPTVATGKVQLADVGGEGGMRGFADRLGYRPAEEEVLLTGWPARTTFRSVVHSAAKPEASGLLPLKRGPRHCGQLDSAARDAEAAARTRLIREMHSFIENPAPAKRVGPGCGHR